MIGVAGDDWTLEHLREHARKCIEETGESLDQSVFDRFAARLSYVSGDFTDAGTYQRLATAIGDASTPVFYLEIPPFLFGPVVKQLSDAGLTKAARVVVEKPFGHDLQSARELAAELHQYIDESQLYRIDHFLGKMGTDELLYLRFGNTMIEPIWNRNHIASIQITMAESFGVEDRGHFYDPVGALRDVVVNHLMQVVAVAAMEAPAGDDAKTLKDAKFALFRSIEDAKPSALRARSVRRLSRHRRRRQRLDDRDLRGAVPAHRHLALVGRAVVHPHRQAAADDADRAAGRVPRSAAAAVHGRAGTARPEPNQFVVRLDPSTGTRLILEAHRADAGGTRPITLDMEFAQEGGEGPTPYEVLLLDAMNGDSSRFTRQDGVEETWRIMQPLLDAPPPVHSYAPGTWGPEAAERLLGEHHRWQGPWVEES